MYIRGLFRFLVVASLVFAGGCGTKSATPPVVHGLTVNGFELEYELVPPLSITADANSLAISTGKGQIRVAEGKLWVHNRDYGTVQTKDRISVIGESVTVNGRAREPSGG